METMLAEGAVVERVRRDPSVRLDPWVEHAALIYDSGGFAALGRIYWEYLGIAREFGLPFVTFSPTWRANPERLRQAGLEDRDVNGDGVRFLQQIVSESGNAEVFAGGLMGCRGDAYRPEEALGEAEATSFHAEQARALAAAGPDFLFGATLPAASEARGMARALAGCGLPYFLSFVITAEGKLLDGTPMGEAMASIDAGIAPAPAGYFVNCVHPETLEAALGGCGRLERLVGFQGNTSRRAPAEREGLAELEGEDPGVFADWVERLRVRFGLRVVGGCCGTDGRHIRAIAERIAGAA
ncbi:MAG: homocysteine S-methyltransferase family protein [Acidobacteriota bacterium]